MGGFLSLYLLEENHGERVSKAMAPLATLAAGVAAAYFADRQVEIAGIQVDTAKNQADTAAAQLAISKAQSVTAREKFRFELFDKRYPVTREVGDFFKIFAHTGKATQEMWHQLNATHYNGAMLFGEGFKELMIELKADVQEIINHDLDVLHNVATQRTFIRLQELDAKMNMDINKRFHDFFVPYVRFAELG